MQRALLVRILMVATVVGAIQTLTASSDQFVILDPYGPVGINDHGDIVGAFGDDTGLHGFLLSRGTVTIISSPPCPVPSRFGPQMIANGVNNRGEVVGGYNPCGNEGHGFIWSDGTLTTIDVPNEPFPDLRGINDHGDIVGFTAVHGFLLSKGMFTALVAPDTTEDVPVPFGINNSGDIVGDLGGDAFLLSKSRYTLFRVPGSGFTEARGINDRGDIVGFWMDEQGSIHGYVLTTKTFTEITLPIASTVAVNAINNSREIVGGFTDLDNPSGTAHGFEMRIKVP
jgi:probable HAF family extracellular repeat protein